MKRMSRKIRLHDHLARQRGAPGAARHLKQQGREPLGRPEIGAVECVVGAKHADQRKAREIVPFGEHLCAHENIELIRTNLLAHCAERAFSARAVAIDAGNASSRETRSQRAFKPLRAMAKRQQIDVAAFRA